jgi:hypothetical protein
VRVNPHVAEARDEYVRLREQMGFRKAAAHVMQKYGVSSTELSASLHDAGLVKARVVDADRAVAA